DAHRERFDEHKQPIGNSPLHGEILCRWVLVTGSVDEYIEVVKRRECIIEHGRLHPIGRMKGGSVRSRVSQVRHGPAIDDALPSTTQKKAIHRVSCEGPKLSLREARQLHKSLSRVATGIVELTGCDSQEQRGSGRYGATAIYATSTAESPI